MDLAKTIYGLTDAILYYYLNKLLLRLLLKTKTHFDGPFWKNKNKSSQPFVIYGFVKSFGMGGISILVTYCSLLKNN